MTNVIDPLIAEPAPVRTPPSERRSHRTVDTSDHTVDGVERSGTAATRCADRIPPEVARAGSSRRGAVRDGAAKRNAHRWARLLHVYTSMIALVVVLFFAVTGLVLNHPEWVFGTEATTTVSTGTFDTVVVDESGGVDFLAISEYVRSEYDVSGSVVNYDETDGDGFITYANAGYSADVFFDVDTGEYEVSITQEGFVEVMTDLHKGSDTGSAWGWVIDASAIFLAVISASGLALQFFLRKRRRSALTTAAVGGVLVLLAMWITLG